MTVVETESAAVSTLLDAKRHLLLVRLLATAKKPPSPSTVRKSLDKFFDKPPTTEQFQSWVDEVREAGLVHPKRMELTAQGRDAALEFLKVEQLPAKCDWRALQAKYLVPRGLSLYPDSPNVQTKVARRDKLAALLLKRLYDLELGPDPSLNEVFAALVCRELGFEGIVTLQDLKRRVLSRLIGEESMLRQDQLEKLVPQLLLETNGSGFDAIRAVAIQRLIGESRSPKPLPTTATEGQPESTPEVSVPREPMDLKTFGNTVRAIGRNSTTGWFGDNKVFLNHIWRQAKEEAAFEGMDWPAFRERLLEANREGLLTLSRADLVTRMPPEDVRESEISYLNATFHFLLIEEGVR